MMTKELFDRIVAVLLPEMDDPSARQALIGSALFGSPVLQKIQWAGAARPFTISLVKLLNDYGELPTRQSALAALLCEAREQVGIGQQTQITELLSQLSVKSHISIEAQDSVMDKARDSNEIGLADRNENQPAGVHQKLLHEPFPLQMEQQEDVIFIHLSDIHFKKELSGTVHDFDQDIRDQLSRHAKQSTKSLGKIHGVLVTGDIAFAGKEAEYKIAEAWLAELCDAIGCPRSNVWVVPGNHDVDREVIRKNTILQDCHERFRQISRETIDHELRRKLTDDAAKKYLFDPIKNYNDFAKLFGCQVSADQLFWEDDVTLNDGSTLRLRGLNSTLISNERDDDESNKLLLGQGQSICREMDGVEYLTLCHHPPQWLRDQDQVTDYLNQRVKIQLFGHKHRQRWSNGARGIILTAGAMHPERRENDWQPRYNFLAIGVLAKDKSRRLRVRVYPKIWHDQHKTFVAETQLHDQQFVESFFDLPWWETPQRLTVEQAGLEHITGSGDNTTLGIAANAPPLQSVAGAFARKGDQSMNRTRRLTYRFYTLPYNVRLRIAQNLLLIREEDKDVPDAQIFAQYYQRAKEMQILAKLWDEVERSHPDSQVTENPFSDQ